MAKKHSILLTGLITLSTLATLILLLTGPSWSSSARLFVTSAAPEHLPAKGQDLILPGGGFSPTTRLWLVPELSIRSATTASLETFGSPQHMVYRDDRLYVANGVRGFSVVQGVQSDIPFISGILDGEGQGLEIFLRRHEAVMATGNNGLEIIDIRDDANPRLLATLKSLAPGLSVFGSGEIVYVATGKSGVQIVDLADPRHPRHLGSLPDITEAYRLAGNEKILLIATPDGGWIYDIRRPALPRRLAALPLPAGSNTTITLQGETLYWASRNGRESRVYALDLSQPTAPRLLNSAPLDGIPYGMSCNNEHLAVALGASGTQLFSLSSRPPLSVSTSVAAKNRTQHVLLPGRDLWIADSGGDLLRLDQEKAQALTAAPLLPNLFSRIKPIVTPHLVLFGDRKNLSIFDRREEKAPGLLAQLSISGFTQQYLSADQKTLWLATRDDPFAAPGSLIRVDISRPDTPNITAQIALSHFPIIIGEHGTSLVITTLNLDQPNPYSKSDTLQSLHVVDATEPQSLSIVSTFSLGKVSTGVSLTGQLVVLMQKDGLLQVVDISAPDAPKEVGSLQMPWLHKAAWAGRVDIAVKDRVAFISTSLGKIFLIDLKDHRRPKYLGELTLAGPILSLLISDDLLLATIPKEGIAVIDLKNSRIPEILGTIPLPGHLHHLTVEGGRIWFSHDNSNGLHSLPLPLRLQSTGTDKELIGRLEQSPPPGAYRLWLTDKGQHLLIPGVSWHSR